MLRGLEGSRIALIATRDSEDAVEAVEAALKSKGARVDRLAPGSEASKSEDAWHAGTYAALVCVGGRPSADSAHDARVVQLAREFLVSDKPLAAVGDGVAIAVEAGGAPGRTLAADESLRGAIEAAGGKWVDAPLHVDEALITAPRAGAGEVAAVVERLAQALGNRLEEQRLDETSAMSFPASDPPATSAPSTGHSMPDRKEGG